MRHSWSIDAELPMRMLVTLTGGSAYLIFSPISKRPYATFGTPALGMAHSVDFRWCSRTAYSPRTVPLQTHRMPRQEPTTRGMGLSTRSLFSSLSAGIKPVPTFQFLCLTSRGSTSHYDYYATTLAILVPLFQRPRREIRSAMIALWPEQLPC